jgi:hypothetical protein
MWTAKFLFSKGKFLAVRAPAFIDRSAGFAYCPRLA